MPPGTRPPEQRSGFVVLKGNWPSMADEKKPPTDHDRIVKLEQGLADANRTIRQMQLNGGFADSKALSMRSTRIEQRLERLEFDGALHKDVTAHTVDLVTNHLTVRHGIDEKDNGPDMIFLRKIKRRLAEWAEAVAQMNKRRPGAAS
jgi:hypothetical protein